MDGTGDELVGRVFANRYRVEERLGNGAMGVVYRARHVKIGRAFALKVLRAQLLGKDKLSRRFEREAELAATLRHDNVVSVVDLGDHLGMKYLVMELAEGEPLSALIARGPLSPVRIVSLVKQLCAGLQHAHDAGLIHRDFKPDNVIVDRTDTPRIVDFGISLLREDATTHERGRLTTAGVVLGTPQYMAPEHASGQPIDHRIDLFALGVICFEMITGRMPFDGDGPEVARANMTFDPPSMREVAPTADVDPLLEAFTRKLMARSVDARFPSARAAREVLELIERDRDAARVALGLAPPPIVVPPLPRPMQAMPIVTPRTRPSSTQPGATTSSIEVHEVRSSRWVPILASALVATAGIVAIVMPRDEEPARAPSVAPPPRAQAQPPVVEREPPPPAVIAVPTPVPVPAPRPRLAPSSRAAVAPPVVPLPPTPPPPTDVVPSAAELAQYYAQIGRKLGDLEKTFGQAVTFELWPRYRHIRIQALLAHPDDRRAGMSELRAIAHAADAATPR